MSKIKQILQNAAIVSLLLIAPAHSQNADAMMADASSQASEAPAARQGRTYSQEEIVNRAQHFFGDTSSGLGQAVAKVFRDQGEPVGFIEGTDWNAALGVGIRYGRGTLIMKDGETRPVHWQSPSFGFNTGANASKVFTLVYGLGNPDAVYRRYPGVEGSAFFIAGASATYQKAEGVTLAPIRTGVGMQLGASVGYYAYSRNRRLNPF